MKICELGGTGSSSMSKGMRKDRQPNQQRLIKKREDRRRNHECAADFMETLAAICPQFYGDRD